MWGKKAEIARLKALRASAYKSLGGRLPAGGRIELELRVYAQTTAGDLDNFVTGVCDGLMAAHPRTPIRDEDWSDVAEAVHPRRPVAYEDDSCVWRIAADAAEDERGRGFSGVREVFHAPAPRHSNRLDVSRTRL